MALVSRWHDDDWFSRDPFWRDTWRDRIERDWEDWPRDWPRPREVVSKFGRRDNNDRWWKDWPADWPRMDIMMPKFSSHLDRFDRNWRDDPFWRDLYPRWAEPIFKDGLDVRTNISNDRNRFAVDIDAYQFRPEELTVKTLDDTLLIEGRHEDVRDSDNYTKMYFVRKYQLPPDVHPQDITSSISNSGKLLVEARKPYAAIEGRERNIPIEGSSRRVGSRSSSYNGERIDSGRNSAFGQENYYGRDHRGSNYNLNDRNGGYKTEYSHHSNDGNGSRHESRRSEFREETRGSPPPITTTVPITQSYSRSASRSSRREYSSGGDYRSSSRGPEFRDEHLLRPAPQIDDYHRSGSSRSVRIEREERR